MEAALKINFTYEQILFLSKQLPVEQQIMLTKELENEAIDTRLAKFLEIFHTNELSTETIDKEVEIVRQQIYDRKKHKSYL